MDEIGLSAGTVALMLLLLILPVLFFLTSTIVPNIGIMIRRKIRKNRVDYNILVSVINFIYFFYLVYLCVSHKWALM